MLGSLLAIGWDPELRGVIVVLLLGIALIGGTYMLVGSNLGARLGFLVLLTAFAGWMASMGFVWWMYGIGLKGPEPSWKPANPITIVRNDANLVTAEVLKTPVATNGLDRAAAAAKVATELEAEGWNLLPESDPGRGQAASSADDIIQNIAKEFAAGEYTTVAVYTRGGERYPMISEAIDFTALLHKPHYALVEVAPLIPQRSEPGRAPARPVIDESQPHRYVVMLRDLGAKRQPAIFLTLGAGLIFALLCVLLHRRDKFAMENRKALPA